jgi:hypothetical protein
MAAMILPTCSSRPEPDSVNELRSRLVWYQTMIGLSLLELQVVAARCVRGHVALFDMESLSITASVTYSLLEAMVHLLIEST